MTPPPLQRAALLARTVRHLRPAQVAHRVRLRSQRAALARLPGPGQRLLRRDTPLQAGWPTGFQPLDPELAAAEHDPEAVASGRFTFLRETRELGEPADWEQREAALLWRYHLHYAEWAWSLARWSDRARARVAFTRLWRSWRWAIPFGQTAAWSPYVASLRAWSFCGVFAELVADGPVETEFVEDLALHAGFVRAHLELDVGGNHLVKNLKALVGLGVFLRDERLLGLAQGHLARQLGVQVLGDGGHYERAPAYHAQVLGDLIDVGGLLAAHGRQVPAELGEAIAAMRRWAAVLRTPDQGLPPFNDGARVTARRLRLLDPGPAQDLPLVVLPTSGYAVLRPGPRLHLVADIGVPCPPDLPAHAHADCLGFELTVDGARVVVDTGTSTYEAGPVRSHERSTRAHNTVEVDGCDQTEVWGAFRAARRATPQLLASACGPAGALLRAAHDGYERLPGRPRHERTWSVGADDVVITDRLLGGGRHRVAAWLHFASGIEPVLGADGVVRAGPIDVEVSSAHAVSQRLHHDTDGGPWVSEGFGDRRPAAALEVVVDAELPLTMVTHLRLRDPQPRAGTRRTA